MADVGRLTSAVSRSLWDDAGWGEWEAIVRGWVEAPGYLPPQLTAEVRVAIEQTADIVSARAEGFLLAKTSGFSDSRATLVTMAISELARNILLYADCGEIVLMQIEVGAKRGVVVCALDQGPGISLIKSALAGGYSTSGGLGMGLSGLKSIADNFDIETRLGRGTRVGVLFFAE